MAEVEIRDSTIIGIALSESKHWALKEQEKFVDAPDRELWCRTTREIRKATHLHFICHYCLPKIQSLPMDEQPLLRSRLRPCTNSWAIK
jgi:hypothetical protein